MHGASRRGFTLIELLVVVGVIAFLGSMLTIIIFAFKTKVYKNIARFDVGSIIMALGEYKRQLGAYPPDNAIPVAGWTPATYGQNEVLVYYLGTQLKKGATHYGPFWLLKENKLRDDDGDGLKEYTDPWGNHYLYAENESQSTPTSPVGKMPRGYDVVDPGPDGKLGGTMSPAKGYEDATAPADQELEKDNVTNWSR